MKNNRERIALIGFMATGKSTIGPRLAKRLGYKFVDTDEMVEAAMEMKISEIFEELGEVVFREKEYLALKEALEMKETVISTGGGIILFERNRKLLSENAFVVTLTSHPRIVYYRVKGNEKRPLLKKNKNLWRSIQKMMSEREVYYNICDLKVATDRGSANKCSEKIVAAYNKES